MRVTCRHEKWPSEVVGKREEMTMVRPRRRNVDVNVEGKVVLVTGLGGSSIQTVGNTSASFTPKTASDTAAATTTAAPAGSAPLLSDQIPAGVKQAAATASQAVASQVQVVMSRDLARQAIRDLHLVGNPEFDPQVRGVGPLQRLAVLGFRQRVHGPELLAAVGDPLQLGLDLPPLLVGQREQQPEPVLLADRDQRGEPGEEVGHPARFDVVAAQLHGGHGAHPAR